LFSVSSLASFMHGSTGVLLELCTLGTHSFYY
jgi:hypothetical protein